MNGLRGSKTRRSRPPWRSRSEPSAMHAKNTAILKKLKWIHCKCVIVFLWNNERFIILCMFFSWIFPERGSSSAECQQQVPDNQCLPTGACNGCETSACNGCSQRVSANGCFQLVLCWQSVLQVNPPTSREPQRVRTRCFSPLFQQVAANRRTSHSKSFCFLLFSQREATPYWNSYSFCILLRPKVFLYQSSLHVSASKDTYIFKFMFFVCSSDPK